MKLNLLWNSSNILNGFQNIDPFASGSDGKLMADLDKIDDICADAEATQIIAENVIDYYSFNEAKTLIAYWKKKLRLNGTMVLCGVDAISTAQMYFLRAMPLEEFNKKIYGEGQNLKKCMYTILEIKDLLSNLGLKILKMELNSGIYVVEGQRI